MPEELKRREILKFTAGTVIAARIAIAQEHKFFTAGEYAMVDELTELIIPADEKSPGARAAKVADFIDGTLAEAFEEGERQKWRQGLELVEKLSHQLNHASFAEATTAQREAVLLRMAGNEKQPKAPEETFFVQLKSATVRAYYTSKIGIHNDLDYKGNVLQTREYAGTLPSSPALGSANQKK